MWSDSLDELLRFADKLGMRREWLQVGSTLHFDLVPKRRQAAVAAGAREIDVRTVGSEAEELWLGEFLLRQRAMARAYRESKEAAP